MSSLRPSSPGPHRARVLALTAVVMVSSFCPAIARPAVANSSSVEASAPPAFPDSAHVFNGCHLSTIAYLARFAADFPAERGELLVIVMPNADGMKRPHTLALVTWAGTWWGRDEYFGVFAVGAKTDTGLRPDRLSAKVATALERHSRARSREPGFHRAARVPGVLSTAELVRETTTATQLIPFPATVFWVKDSGREFPFVFFRPSAGKIAVYDPHRGTCLAECDIADDAKVVRLVTSRLGYRSDNVRAAAAGLLASAE